MKRVLILLCLYFTTNTSFAQTLSYGILLGATASSSASKGNGTFINDKSTSFINSKGFFAPNFGAYAEYNFTEKWGLKTEVLFRKTTLKPSGYEYEEGELQLSIMEVSPNIKLDFGSEYRKGGYLLLGPKITFFNKITNEGEKIEEEFKKRSLGYKPELEPEC